MLGAATDGVGAGVGALIGVLLYAPAEALTSVSRGTGEVKPLWQRIFGSALLMALVGWLLGLIGLDEPLPTAILSGGLLGLLGLRPLKLTLGLLVGAVVGVLLEALDAHLEPALVAAAVTIVYRVIAAIAYRNRPLVRMMAEEVPASCATSCRSRRARGTSARLRRRRRAQDRPQLLPRRPALPDPPLPHRTPRSARRAQPGSSRRAAGAYGFSEKGG